MSNKAGTLLWNRKRIAALPAGPTTIDTLLTQVSKSFESSSIAEPPLGIAGVAPPADGALPASRVNVIPLSPLSAWANLTIGEPYFDTATGTVKIVITNGGGTVNNVNVLFWDPHTSVGPGLASTYNAGQ